MNSDARVLAAALLWLRNHYEVGNPELKDRVIERIDRVLKWREPTGADMRAFREMYAADEVPPAYEPHPGGHNVPDILAKLADLHKQATEERSHNYVGACVEEAHSEILRLRALANAVMPLAKALHVLTEAHTRDDHRAGFIVERTAWPAMRSDESRDYIEAWRSVRFNIGKQNEPSS